MFRFSKNQATNTNAVYLDTVNTGSDYYDNLTMVFSQSYDESNGTIQVFPQSTPNQYNSWLTFTLPGVSLVAEKIPTGQYNVEIWTAAEAQEGRWAFIDIPWQNYDQIWETAGEPGRPETFLTSDRAFIEGYNQTVIDQYVSSNENGTYTTYNG